MIGSTASHAAWLPVRVFICLLVVSFFASGCASERFKTHSRVDTSYDFESIESFAFDVKREKVAKSDAGEVVFEALRKGLVARGFEEVEKDDANVWISFDIGVHAYGGLSGANRRTVQQGDITVWVYDAKTGENIFYGWAETSLRASDQREAIIYEAVEAIFANRDATR
jgi:hypothetical protein